VDHLNNSSNPSHMVSRITRGFLCCWVSLDYGPDEDLIMIYLFAVLCCLTIVISGLTLIVIVSQDFSRDDD